MRLQIVNGRIKFEEPTFNPDEILPSAYALFRLEQSQDLRDVIAQKIDDLRHYDIPAMNRVVAICCWGRSGSLLLASYLDGHEDVVMLPAMCGYHLYDFFERYPSLPLHDKLIAYPASQLHYPFFEGDFAISPAQYYAAVEAIAESYDNWKPAFLASRRAFFLFLHIAYNLALGRRPASSHPLIVFAQHDWDDVSARHLVEDFPQAKFIHTVRDPITVCDRLFDSWFGVAERFPSNGAVRRSDEIHLVPKNPSSTLSRWWVVVFQKLVDLLPHQGFGVLALIHRDRPHVGMESQTRAIRFEDLHCDVDETMRDLLDWLGLSYQKTWLDSTFNGIPFVVRHDGKAWSGQRPEQAQRHSRNVSRKDRALLFAVFYENFAAWNYPCPRIYGNLIVRCLVFVSLLLVPMKMEIISARAIFKRRILPSLRHGNIPVVINSLLRILFCRLAIIWLLVPDFIRRCVRRKSLLQVNEKRRRVGSLPET